MKKLLPLALAALTAANIALAQSNTDQSKFRQLGTELPTPNGYRSASGAPGPQYWQQRADYVIDVELDEEKKAIYGYETITYTNNSPDKLDYLWLQLDQNIFAKTSNTFLTGTDGEDGPATFNSVSNMVDRKFDGGYRITEVKDATGKALKITVNKTMMRVDLPKTLMPGAKFVFSVKWWNYINNARTDGGRGGYELFPEDGNIIFEEAQWFPRMAVYDDVWGWQHKQYLGRGEFALDFGNYKVNIKVPSDHVVASTGTLMNTDVLKPVWKDRLKQAETAKKPVLIVTQEEAVQAEKSKSKDKKVWSFYAENVRDFAWASSRKFIWDAKRVDVEGKKVWAMSYYPKEGNPLWGQYSTEAVAHTLNVYSKYSVAYPYPVAISVNGPVGGMEYPMICFNGPRPEKDGTYSERTKTALISVVIHEVGHNFFPMIINSDERQWSWMDEGLNTFLQYLAEKEWDRQYPSQRGEPYAIVPYMKSDKSVLVPIMTNSESVLQFGNNAYGKPATALNILRETVMGRDLFDFAFKTYSKRWAFRHPHPADFFRSMEDASGVDLDWFWRGWFYTTDAVDIAIKSVEHQEVNTQNPEVEKEIDRKNDAYKEKTVSQTLNKKSIKQSLVELDPSLKDFYNSYDPFKATDKDKAKFKDYVASLSDEDKKVFDMGLNFYRIKFENIGGLVMPVIVKFDFNNGTDTVISIPAEIWRMNNKEVSKTFAFTKSVKQITLDPFLETADIDLNNNFFPQKMGESRLNVIKSFQRPQTSNPMREAKEAEKPKR